MRERWMKEGDTTTYKGLLTWFIKVSRKNRNIVRLLVRKYNHLVKLIHEGRKIVEEKMVETTNLQTELNRARIRESLYMDKIEELGGDWEEIQISVEVAADTYHYEHELKGRIE